MPLCQNFRKFRSKRKWNGSIQVEIFRSKWSTSTGGPLWPVGPVQPKLPVPFPKILVSSPTLLTSSQTFGRNVNGAWFDRSIFSWKFHWFLTGWFGKMESTLCNGVFTDQYIFSLILEHFPCEIREVPLRMCAHVYIRTDVAYPRVRLRMSQFHVLFHAKNPVPHPTTPCGLERPVCVLQKTPVVRSRVFLWVIS